MFHRPKGLTFAAALRDIECDKLDARLEAIHCLGNANTEEECEQALRALAAGIGDPHPAARAAVCDAFASLLDPEAWEVLALCLSDEVSEVRQRAALALGDLKAAEAYDVLAEALTEGPCDLRYQAAGALCEVAPKRAYPVLTDALRREEDPEVLGAIVLALGEIGNPECADQIVLLLAHQEGGTRFDAAYALGMLGDARGLEALGASMGDEDRGMDAIHAMQTLGQDSEPLLRSFIENSDNNIQLRLQASASLISIECADSALARVLLITSLRAFKSDVRRLALTLLYDCAGPWAKEPLLDFANSFRGRRYRGDVSEIIEIINASHEKP